MQLFMAIEIPALTMDLMLRGHLSITATITIKTNPVPFPSHPSWCYFTSTIEQHHYVQAGGNSRSHNNSQVPYSIIIT